MTQLFKVHSTAENADVLAQFLPNSPLFAGKDNPDDNLYKLLFGMASTLKTVEEKLSLTYSEYDFRTTELFIDEWEAALGIPDSCFTGTGTLEERRINVHAKFLSYGVQTEEDFIAIAALFGIEISIVPGRDQQVFPFTFPYTFQTVKEARFTMFVFITVVGATLFPYTFPILFGNTTIPILKCLFKKLAPANVRVIFKEV